jgi:hypothetical protein
MFRSSSNQPAERDSVGLPFSDPQHIVILRQEYEDAVQRGGEGAMDKCFKYVASLDFFIFYRIFYFPHLIFGLKLTISTLSSAV